MNNYYGKDKNNSTNCNQQIVIIDSLETAVIDNILFSNINIVND